MFRKLTFSDAVASTTLPGFALLLVTVMMWLALLKVVVSRTIRPGPNEPAETPSTANVSNHTPGHQSLVVIGTLLPPIVAPGAGLKIERHGVAVPVGDAVAVGVALLVGVGVLVGVAVRVGVGVFVAVGVAVAVRVAVAVAVGIAVGVAEAVGVGVLLDVGVTVGDGVAAF